MALSPCEHDSASVVLVGDFNPAIFQPSWFAAKGLFREEEATAADLRIVHRDLTSFTIGWLQLEVARNRLFALADFGHAEALRDLTLGVFQLLEHTPFNQMGINRHMHFRMASTESRNGIGEKLAPPGPWSPELGTPVMRTLVMQGKRVGSKAEYLNVKVEPSAQIPNVGVFVETNEHYQKPAAPGSASELLAILAESWHDSLGFGKTVARHVLGEKEE